MRFSSMALLTSALALGACECGSGGTAVDGPHPYVRCGERAPREGSWGTGALRFTAEERTLRVEGLDRFVALSALGTDLLPELPQLPVLVIGGATTPGLVEALAPRPLLLLPGGGDDAEAYAELFVGLDAAERDRVVDLAGVYLLETPHRRFVVLPGADAGRYARGAGSCGFGDADVEARVGLAEGAALLAWHAPLGVGAHSVDRGFGGVHAGSARLSALAARGGLFAFPRTSAGLAASADGTLRIADGELRADLALVVPTLGVETERYDEGVSARGFVVIELDAEGLRVAVP
jgi:hypothetical protein